MIHTFAIDYNHDSWDKSERFKASVDELLSTGVFRSTPVVESTPVYSYGRCGRQHLDAVFERIGDGEAIVLLSEICMHSYLLVQTRCSAFDELTPFASYESLETLRNSAMVSGHHVGAGEAKLLRDDHLVISSVPWAFLDERYEPDSSIVDVVERLGRGYRPIFAYRIRNFGEHYSYALRSDEPFYVLSDEQVDVREALQHYREETLTEHLQSLQIPFGTFGDNHMDDLYTVSYREPFWRGDDGLLAFVA